MGISETGVHLLRNRYNYRTLPFHQITRIRIGQGREVKNWLLVWLFGAGCFAAGLVAAYQLVYDYFFDPTVLRFHILRIVFPVLPLCMGVYAMLAAVRKGYVLHITAEGKVTRLVIQDLYRKGQLGALEHMLQEHPVARYKFYNGE